MLRDLRLPTLTALLALVIALPAHAALKVLATTPDWASLLNELGGDKVNVYTATSPFQDVHRVDAKPSLVARARSADLVVATGADLEIGWLPVLLQDSGNTRIQPGSAGYFEAAPLVHLLEVPSAVDRSMGDIHPLGNPHVTLDPRNIAIIAKALAARLTQVDAGNAAYYASRGEDFQKRWAAATAKWESQAAPLKGIPVVVIHRDQVYLVAAELIQERRPVGRCGEHFERRVRGQRYEQRQQRRYGQETTMSEHVCSLKLVRSMGADGEDVLQEQLMIELMLGACLIPGVLRAQA